MSYFFELLRSWLLQYGYATVAAGLLLENAGLPVPGETVLLLASFLAFSHHRLELRYVIWVGIVASSVGNQLGYAAGSFGGRRLLERYQKVLRISPQAILRGEKLFADYGPVAILVARFIAGLRILAGPLAGALRMPGRKFALWNVLGAVVWVTSIATIGYLSGRHWDRLVEAVKSANLIALGLGLALVVLFWWRARRKRAL